MTEKYTLHITYDELINLTCLNKVLDAISKGYNDVNRKAGITNTKEISKLNPIITNFREGSLIIDLIVNLGVGIVSGIIANCIYARITDLKEKNIDVDFHYTENDDGSKTIDLHIHKDNKK